MFVRVCLCACVRFSHGVTTLAVCLRSLSWWKMKLFPIRHFPDGFTWWLKIWRYSSALIIPFFFWQHSQHRWLKYSARPWESFRRVLNLLHITVPHFMAFSSIILCAEAVSQPVLRWHGPIYLNCNELRLLIPQSLTSLCEHKNQWKHISLTNIAPSETFCWK